MRHRGFALFVLISSFLILPAASSQEYASLRPVQAQPVAEASSEGILVHLGPGNLRLPKGWQVTPGTIGAEMLSPSGLAAKLMVLEPRVFLSTPPQLPSPSEAVMSAMTTLCAPVAPSKVDVIRSHSGQTIHFSSCAEKSQDGSATFQLFYELRQGQFVLLLLASGQGTVASARRLLETAAKSAHLE